MPPTPEGGLHPAGSRNSAHTHQRAPILCKNEDQGACPPPLKVKNHPRKHPKKAVLLQVVFSSFFVITFFGTIGGIDTQQVTRPN